MKVHKDFQKLEILENPDGDENFILGWGVDPTYLMDFLRRQGVILLAVVVLMPSILPLLWAPPVHCVYCWNYHPRRRREHLRTFV